MVRTIEKYTILQKIKRMLKFNFVKLLRSPEGSHKTALGFAIGFGMEMLVVSTAGLIYVLLIPIIRLSRASLPVAIIGNLIGKVSLLPVILLPLALKIGRFFYPGRVRIGQHFRRFSFTDLLHGDLHGLMNLLYGGIHVLIGMMIFGGLLGFISYFIVSFLYEKEKSRRIKKGQGKRDDVIHSI